MFRRKPKPETSDSTWGGGDDFWGENSSPRPLSEAPPAAEVPASIPAAPPMRKRPLIEHLEPLFLYVLQQHRIVRESAGSASAFDSVRIEVRRLIDAINEAARYDPLLRQHFEKLKDPIHWYVDSTFTSPENRFPYQQKWIESRLGEYGVGGNLVGDDAFFDKLKEELRSNPSDEAANERLVFYYMAIGLGFTGCYFNPTPAHRAALKDFMDRIYPRITRFLDTDASGRITPESYRYTDKRDFVKPSREKPIIFFAASLLLFATLLIGYLHQYQQAKKTLRIQVEQFEKSSPSNDDSGG